MRLKLVIEKTKAEKVRIDELDPASHYIGCVNTDNDERFALRRDDKGSGLYRWTCLDGFTCGGGMLDGDYETIRECIDFALSDGSCEIVVFTTPRELFNWLLEEEAVQ